jgi:hypothetical protein
MTLRPAALSARALSVTAMVADGLTRLSWSARKAIESSESGVCRTLYSVVIGQNGDSKTQKSMHSSRLLMI